MDFQVSKVKKLKTYVSFNIKSSYKNTGWCFVRPSQKWVNEMCRYFNHILSYCPLSLKCNDNMLFRAHYGRIRGSTSILGDEPWFTLMLYCVESRYFKTESKKLNFQKNKFTAKKYYEFFCTSNNGKWFHCCVNSVRKKKNYK